MTSVIQYLFKYIKNNYMLSNGFYFLKPACASMVYISVVLLLLCPIVPESAAGASHRKRQRGRYTLILLRLISKPEIHISPPPQFRPQQCLRPVKGKNAG
jgi:hypothetical protein